jgi:hypothetical protein
VKARILCLSLLLAACSPSDVGYKYEVSWTCLSPEGCERTDAVMFIDRLNVIESAFFFLSTRTTALDVTGQRVADDSLPEGCEWLYGVTIFAHELEPFQACRTADGYEMEFSIPNAIPTTHSIWLVEARDFGPLQPASHGTP